MILQRCKVVRTETADGKFKMPDAAKGMEVWVMPATIAMVRVARRGESGEFKVLMVRAKDQLKPIPVEILEFYSDFQVEGNA